jgi:hypothetical protein
MGDGGRAQATAGRGQGECPGRGGASQHDGGVWKSGIADRGVGEGGRRGLRIADTHLPGEERKTTKHTGRYPCGSRARLVLAGDAVGTGKGCRQEVRRGAGRLGRGRGEERACVTRGWAIQA